MVASPLTRILWNKYSASGSTGLFINDVITGRGGGGVSQRMTNDDEGEEGIHSKSDSVCGICLQNSAEKCINYADKISRQKCEIIKITRISLAFLSRPQCVLMFY